MTLGEIATAVSLGTIAIGYTDRSQISFHRVLGLTAQANAVHQAGDPASALALFKAAEVLQQKEWPGWLFLSEAMSIAICYSIAASSLKCESGRSMLTRLPKLDKRLLDGALALISLGNAAFALGECSEANILLNRAVDGLRRAGTIDHLPCGLLARAALLRETRNLVEARRDLEEAMRVAKRSEMRLFQCDAHLGFARLAVVEGNQATARRYVAEARRVVEATGYRRRRAEIKELELLLDSGLT